MLLSACGSSSDDEADIDAARLRIDYEQVKKFVFTWRDVRDATSYKLLENPDGKSGFTQIGDDIPPDTQSFEYVVPLYSRINAQFLLQTCFDTDCNDSSTVFVSEALAGSIGYFKASNTNANDRFGGAVSISADGATLAVGAPREASNATGINGDQDNNSSNLSGAVYVYIRNGNEWVQQAYIKASNAGVGDLFGGAVSLSADGNTLAVGAAGEGSNATGINGNEDDNTSGSAGAVYVFTRSDSDWNQQAYVKASNTDAGDLFGSALELSADGNTLAVGAASEGSGSTGVNGDEDDNSNGSAGAVYVFIRSDGDWNQQAYVKASNTDPGDLFGGAVSLSDDGNTLAIGAGSEGSGADGIDGDQNDNSNGSAGAAYVFIRSDGDWNQQAYVKASNSDPLDRFGGAVDLSGDGNTLVAGATGERSSAIGVDGDQGNDVSGSNFGALYAFTRVDSDWSQQAYIKASNTSINDLFGGSASLSADGNTLVVGATGERSSAIGLDGDQGDDFSGSSFGAVYVFIRDGTFWSQQSYVKASNTGSLDRFGTAVSLDETGAVLSVGATGERSNAAGISGDQSNNNAFEAGAVYLY